MMGLYPNKVIACWNKISQKFKFYLHHNSASPTFNTLWTFTSATVGQNHLPKAYYIMVLNISCDVSTIVLYVKDGLIYVYRPVVSILTVIILLTGSWGHTATALFMKDHYSAYHQPSKGLKRKTLNMVSKMCILFLNHCKFEKAPPA